ncbi:hypothetical protein HanPI659440_Chr14g0573021 [Helianthus annuus]|nr:hypothetical protein HanPI659440_Chr14g0573021 [Helianthus annuus]
MNKFQHLPQITIYSTSGFRINSSPCWVENASQAQGTCASASTLTPPQTNKFKVKNTYYIIYCIQMSFMNYRCFLMNEFHRCIICFSCCVTSTKSSSI